MLLQQKEVLILLQKYSILYPKTVIIKTVSDIDKFSYPAVLKIDSPEVSHKSDLGLVITDIKNSSEAKQKLKLCEDKLKKYNINDYRFILQKQIEGQEIIIGMKRDPIFGPAILFGLGGVFVEVLKDYSMRIAPLSRKDCLDMINEIKGKKILSGFRNIPAVNKEKIISLLLKISKLAMNETEILEIDFNPVMINRNAEVVDARIIKKDA